MTPKEECETLLDQFLPLVEQHLEKRGGFLPVSAVLDAEGEATLNWLHDESLAGRPTSELVDGYVDLHAHMAEERKIAASFFCMSRGLFCQLTWCGSYCHTEVGK